MECVCRQWGDGVSRHRGVIAERGKGVIRCGERVLTVMREGVSRHMEC